MKHDLFRVKDLELMGRARTSQNLKASILGNEKLTVKNIALIREFRRTIKITNVGDFPSEVIDVTLSNHASHHKSFSIRKMKDSYELTYYPDFRHSKVSETILVKTKYSITEFKVEAFIPMYLIKFVDNHFRLTEVEESIGNWYYLIVVSFLLLTLLCLGTEVVEYIIFLKQKNINYSLLTELLNAYEKAQEQVRHERQLNITTSKESDPKSKKPPSKKSPVKANIEPEVDPRITIEEIKKQLADKIDFNEVSSTSSVLSKKQTKKQSRNSNPCKSDLVNMSKKESKHITQKVKQQSIKQDKKQKDSENPFEVQMSPEKANKKEKILDITPKRMTLEKSSLPSNSDKVKHSISSESKKIVEEQKVKPSKKKQKQEVKKNKVQESTEQVKEIIEQQVVEVDEPAIIQSSATITQPARVEEQSQIVKQSSSKTSEYKRRNQRNQPKQNKIKGLAPETFHENVQVEEVNTTVPNSQSLTTPESTLQEEQKVDLHKPQKVSSNNEEKKEEKASKNATAKPGDDGRKSLEIQSTKPKTMEDEKLPANPNKAAPQTSKKKHEKTPKKVYKRQESSQASATSEPSQNKKDLLSNAQSKTSLCEPEESLNPHSEYTEESEGKNTDNMSEKVSRNSSMQEEIQETQKTTPGKHRRAESHLQQTNQHPEMANKQQKAGRRNLDAYNKASSYQNYKKELREQKNKQKQNVSNSSYGKGYKYTTQKDAEYKSQLKADDQNSSYSIQPDHYKVGQDYFSQSHGGGLNKYREDRNSKETPVDPQKESIDETDHQKDTIPVEVHEEEKQIPEPQIEDKKPQVKQRAIAPDGFYDDEEPELNPTTGPYSMFSAFQTQEQEFSLFTPTHDDFLGNTPMNFDFLEDCPSPREAKEEDEVFNRFGNLQELREESELYSYDIANKDIFTKIQK